jgi:hypothetical protein
MTTLTEEQIEEVRAAFTHDYPGNSGLNALCDMALQHRRSLAGEQEAVLAKYQPCGCIICTCESNADNRCLGCGAKHCGSHPLGEFQNPLYTPTAQWVSVEDVRGAVARGWCTKENSHKEMDSTLALAIADEVMKLLPTAPHEKEGR